MRFLLDHDVDAAVGQMLRHRGHECWAAGSAGLARAKDDELTVWAIGSPFGSPVADFLRSAYLDRSAAW